MKYHVFSCINWDFFWQQHQEVALSLSRLGDVRYYNPIKVKNKSLIHLNGVAKNPIYEKVEIVNAPFILDDMDLNYIYKQEKWFLKMARNASKDDVFVFYVPAGQSMAFRYAVKTNKKIILMYADDYLTLSKSRLSKLFMKVILPFWFKKSDVVFCSSKVLIERASKRYRGNFVFLPNGVNLDLVGKFSQGDLYGVKKEKKFVVGYSGGIDEDTKIDDLIYLAAKNQDIEVWVISGGKYNDYYADKAEREKVLNIKFLGTKSRGELQVYIKNFDLAVMPFKRGSWKDICCPVKMFEYWAAKKAVLTTETPELKYYSESLVFYKDKYDLVKTIEILIKNPGHLRQLGELGYNSILKNHDWASSLRNNFLEEVRSVSKGGVYVEAGSPWNGLKQHAHEVAFALEDRFRVLFLEPAKVFKDINNAPRYSHDKKSIDVVESFTMQVDGVLALVNFFLKQNIYNLSVFKSKIRFYDVYISYYPYWSVLSFILAKILKKKTVFIYADDYANLFENKLVKLYMNMSNKFFLKRFDKVICTAKSLVNEAEKYNKNVIYLPNGVHLEEYKKIKAKTNFNFKNLKIGFIGSLGPWVKIEDFVTIAQNFPKNEVHVIGGGERYNELAEIAKNNRLVNLKTYGFMPRDKAYEVLKDVDAAIIPFIKNRLTDAVSPIKLFEYWALEKPVIATKTKELLQYDKEVFLYDCKDELLDIVDEFKDKKIVLKKIEDSKVELTKSHDWSGSLKEKYQDLVSGLFE